MLILKGVDEIFIHGSHQCRALEIFLTDNKTQFEGKLIGDLKHINYRAECFNGIKVESVQHCENNEYLLDYSYEWHVYNGCSNMDGYDREWDAISFSIGSNGEIEFDFLILAERTTCEEF